MTAARVLPVGRHALLVEVAGPEQAQALHAELVRRRASGELPPVRDIVPAARTVLLDGVTAPGALAAELAAWRPPPNPPAPRRKPVVLPVRYDGPDLPEVAARWGVSRAEVAALHARCTFRVAFCGFAPGFGYLTGLPRRLHVPRRATPRSAVPPGSVGLAGPYTGVYPRSSPGGWQVIGRTEEVLWDPEREPAALLEPGTEVRFTPLGACGGNGLS